MLEKDAESENCDADEEEGESLSRRMHKLNSRTTAAKSLSSLERLQSEGAICREAETESGHHSRIKSREMKQSKRRELLGGLLKTAVRGTSKQKKESYRL
jgi:hypothetical protein